MATVLNTRFERQNQFLATSEFAKVQTGFGVAMANSLLNYRENCTVELSRNISRDEKRDCAEVNLTGEPMRRRWLAYRFIFNDFSPQRAANYVALKEGVASAMTGSAANAVHTISRTGTVSGGSFILTFDIEGKAGSTSPIPYNATAAEIQAAILKRNAPTSSGRILQPGDVVVSGDWTNGIVLTYGGRYANAPMAIPAVNNTSITGGGSVGAVSTTAGSQKVCDISRSTGSAKRLFSFALGDLGGDLATDKYTDAAVDTVEFGISETGLPTMTVSGVCAYIPDEQSSFSVPPCVSGNEVEITEIKVLVDDIYEQRDIVSETITISDNIPAEGMFVVDDVDISRPPRRGNQPSQDISLGVYGTKTARLAVLAENEIVKGNEAEVVTEVGLAKNRLRIIAPEAKIKWQGNPAPFAGPLNEQVVEVNATPYGITGDPLVYEYYGSQSEQFLLTA